MNISRHIILTTGLFLTGALFAQSVSDGTADANETTQPAPLPDVVPVTSLQVGAGFDYSRGDYGFAQDTEVFSIPVLLTYNTSQWIFRGSIPYVRIDGPADAVGTSGAGGSGGGGGRGGGGLGGLVPGLPASGTNASNNNNVSTPSRPISSSESGLGDVVLGATRMLGPVFGPVQVDLTARLKLPTADDDKGLGTGETDYYAQADFYHVGDVFIPFATIGYRIMSDSGRYDFKNGPYASIGSAYRLSEETRVGASFDWRSRIVDGGDDATEVSVFLAHNLTSEWSLTLYALKGFTDASPEMGAGGSISYKF